MSVTVDVTKTGSNGLFMQDGDGAVARSENDKLRDFVSVKDFGATGDGTTNDTTAITDALASLSSGGALYFPPGTYVIQRGTGALIADTIVASNVLVFGAGAASIVKGFNSAGATPNNAGNQYYNVFQATSRSNITIRDLSFQGYTTPVAMFSCDGVVVENIADAGLLSNAGGYLRDKSIFVDKCSNVRIAGNKIDNAQFGVYLSGDATTKTKGVAITGNHFMQTAAAGSFTSLFPVGVYQYYADDVAVTGNTFEDIYSSLDSGGTGTGMGYGFYEGDGAANQVTLTGNTFRFNGKGLKQAIGAYINQALNATVTGNSFVETSGVSDAILVDAKVAGCQRTVTGNTFDLNTARGVYFALGGGSFACRLNVANNTFEGGNNAIRAELPLGEYIIANNVCNAQAQSAMHFLGQSSAPIKFPLLQGNRITASQQNAILFSGYVVSPQVIGNTILDGNLSNQAGNDGAAIRMTTYSHGGTFAGNTIGNTPGGGGLFTMGVQNANNATDRIFKDMIGENTFIGLGNNNQFGSGGSSFLSAQPTEVWHDTSKGDYLRNVMLDASEAPGWHCVLVLRQTLAADASSASTTVTVGSTSSMVAGDAVLICKDSNPYDADYTDSTKWHRDTISSVTDATNFVLTTGIPAGDGTYVSGTGRVVVGRWRAAAAIAA